MKKLTFDIQAIIIVVTLGVGHLLDGIAHLDFCRNIAWVLCGLLVVINPVWPQSFGDAAPDRKRLETRIAGIIIILLGLFV